MTKVGAWGCCWSNLYFFPQCDCWRADLTRTSVHGLGPTNTSAPVSAISQPESLCCFAVELLKDSTILVDSIRQAERRAVALIGLF
jgi:hypothetical protein